MFQAEPTTTRWARLEMGMVSSKRTGFDFLQKDLVRGVRYGNVAYHLRLGNRRFSGLLGG